MARYFPHYTFRTENNGSDRDFNSSLPSIPINVKYLFNRPAPSSCYIRLLFQKFKILAVVFLKRFQKILGLFLFEKFFNLKKI